MLNKVKINGAVYELVRQDSIMHGEVETGCDGCSFINDMKACSHANELVPCATEDFEDPSCVFIKCLDQKAELESAEQKHQDDPKLGRKFDSDKPRFDLIPPMALEEMVKVLTIGAKKYAPDNWKYVDNAHQRYFAAAQRHIWAYKRGEFNDPETGLHHLAHAACCIYFMLELDLDPSLDENNK